MANNTATNVSTGRPNISGSVYVAPIGTTLPTDATTPLDSAFKSLGYVSEDGLKNANDLTMSAIKEWGGVVVYRSLTEMVDNFKLALLESTNVNVLKTVYGENNVDQALDSDAISIEVKAEDPQELVYVFELALRGNKKKRIVVPDAAITAREEISYTSEDAIMYGITVSAYPDENNSTHKEYIA